METLKLRIVEINTTAYAEENFLLLTNLSDEQIQSIIAPIVLAERNQIDNDEEETEFISELFDVQFLPAVVVLSETGYKKYEGSIKIKKLL